MSGRVCVCVLLGGFCCCCCCCFLFSCSFVLWRCDVCIAVTHAQYLHLPLCLSVCRRRTKEHLLNIAKWLVSTYPILFRGWVDVEGKEVTDSMVERVKPVRQPPAQLTALLLSQS